MFPFSLISVLALFLYYVTIYKKVWRKLSKGQLDLTF